LKRALITGITGQDGSYLAEWLLTNGYEVHGIIRPSSTSNTERIAHLAGRVHLHQADLLDQGSLIAVIQKVDPAEVYNLAAMSSVPSSWQQPILAGEFTALGVTRVLEAIQDPLLMRPAEVDSLVGDSSNASRILGWRPEIDFKDLIRQMVKADLERVTNENSLRVLRGNQNGQTDVQFREPASSRPQTE
jgi:GDP-D-mannose dehydratase